MRALRIGAAVVVACTMSLAQNCEMQHKDGTTTFTSRAGNNLVAAGIYQRYPADQTCGAVTLSSFNMLLQDQDQATVEDFTLVIRGNAAGAPDITAAGVLGFAGFVGASFGGGIGPAAVYITVTFAGAGLPLPIAGGGAVPADDIYAGVDLPATTGANPAWPGDGVSSHANATSGADLGEQFRATWVGYTGVAGVAGLGWSANLTAGTTALAAGNRSWSPAIRPAQDVLQPFASNPGVFIGGATAGLNPNFGYAGLAPDPARGDLVGLRLRSNAPIGSTVILIYDGVSFPRTPLGVDGDLCLNLATLTIFTQFFTTVAPGAVPPLAPSHTSEVIIGPVFLPLMLGNVFAQTGTLDPGAVGGVRISTLAHFNL